MEEPVIRAVKIEPIDLGIATFTVCGGITCMLKDKVSKSID